MVLNQLKDINLDMLYLELWGFNNNFMKTSKYSLWGLSIITWVICIWIYSMGQFDYGVSPNITYNRYDYREMLTTAYSEYDSCHYEGCLMANGERAYVGAVACNCLPFGTEIEIAGVKYVVKDRHSKSLNCRVDIFMGYGEQAYQDAINYGKKLKIIKIIL